MTRKEIVIKEKLIIKNIKVLAKELGKTPTKRDYLRKYGNPQFENVGGFSLMLEKAGFIRNKHNNLSDEDIKRIFKEYIKKNGVPISHKFPKTLPSYDLVCSRFRSYKSFLNSIGYDSFEKSYTKDKIIELLRKGIDRGDIKSVIDLAKKDFPVPATIYKILGVTGWKETLKLIDRELNSNYNRSSKYNYTQEELKTKYLELSKKLSKNIRGASKYDVKEHLGITQDVFQRVFNKAFTELKKEWGFQVRKRNSIYTQEMILELLRKKMKEKGRELTIREIISDDELPAMTTIYKIFNTTSLKDIYSVINIEKRGICSEPLFLDIII